MANQAATDSFRFRGIPKDIHDATLQSMLIWSPDESYEEWRISLRCEPHVRGMVCVQLRLGDNSDIVDPVSYGPPDQPRATTTSFTASPHLFSSLQAAQIIEFPFVPGTTFCLSDFIGMLRDSIPGYQLPDKGTGSSGSQGWVLLVVDMLIEGGRLSGGSRSLLEQAIHAIRTTNPDANTNIGDPIVPGMVYRVV